MLVIWLAGCGKEPEPPDTGTLDTSSTTLPDTGTADTGTTDTGPTDTDTGLDCATLPPAPLSTLQLGAARGYHDLAFDPQGHLVGSDGNSLLRVTYDDQVSVFVPNTGVVQGMDWLPDGDLVYADDVGSLIRVTPDGVSSLLAGGSGSFSVYGVRVGPDGMVYTATWTTIERHDPQTGQRTTLLSDPAVAPYVLAFSPDYRKLYVGTIWSDGALWALDLDDNLDPVGPPTLLATVGDGEDHLHDALSVDVCGNLYVAEYYTSNLYRVTPEGEVSVFLDYHALDYGHGLRWGSGVGGWRTDALYAPQPYDGNRVLEIVVGLP